MPVGRWTSTTQVATLFTFWPPLPPECTKLSSRSSARTPSRARRSSRARALSPESGMVGRESTVTPSPPSGEESASRRSEAAPAAPEAERAPDGEAGGDPGALVDDAPHTDGRSAIGEGVRVDVEVDEVVVDVGD